MGDLIPSRVDEEDAQPHAEATRKRRGERRDRGRTAMDRAESLYRKTRASTHEEHACITSGGTERCHLECSAHLKGGDASPFGQARVRTVRAENQLTIYGEHPQTTALTHQFRPKLS